MIQYMKQLPEAAGPSAAQDSSRFNDITSHRYPTCGIVNLSWDTGEGWSNMAGKVAYESRRDYIIAVKGKMRLRVTLSTQSESESR